MKIFNVYSFFIIKWKYNGINVIHKILIHFIYSLLKDMYYYIFIYDCKKRDCKLFGYYEKKLCLKRDW